MEASNEMPPRLGPIDPATAGALKLMDLGVTEAAANDRPGELRGQVRWQPAGVDGEVELDLEGFGSWLNDFLTSSLAQDKIDKVNAVPGELEKHLLVLRRHKHEHPRTPGSMPWEARCDTRRKDAAGVVEADALGGVSNTSNQWP